MTVSSELVVIIVGCGLGGLTCAIQCLRQGCRVLILERAPQILAIGAGIMVPPNAMKVLRHLGLADSLMRKGAIQLEGLRYLNYNDGDLLYQKQGGDMTKEYGDPWCCIHRAEYHETLYEEAQRLGCEIRLDCEAVSVSNEDEFCSVTTKDGEVIQGDVIVGADGLWSTLRDQLLGRPTPPEPTGDLAYRMTLSGELLSKIEDPSVQELIRPNIGTIWLGPDKHCVLYPMRNRTEWNLVLMRPDNLPGDLRTQAVEMEEVNETFQDWDPRLQRLLSTSQSVISFKLLHFPELEVWSKGRTILLGDACHASLPYQAQGAAMALEDGLTLGHLLGCLQQSKAQLSARQREERLEELLHLFESLRKYRTSLNQKGSQSNQFWYQTNGKEQMEHRNQVFRAADGLGDCQWKGADAKYQKELLGFDAQQAVLDALAVSKLATR